VNKDDEIYKHYFPVPRSVGLTIGVKARRDGAPIGWNGGIPIMAQYVLLDEFGTPMLDASLCWFQTGEEALFVAEIYLKLLEEKHPCADRFFSDAYAAYARLKNRLPELVRLWKLAESSQAKRTQAISKFLLDL